MSYVTVLLDRVLDLKVGLSHAVLRLTVRSDTEALHDLRTGLRRLRSLLRPLRDVAGCDGLDEAAAAVGRLTTPARDLEVLAAELERHGLRTPATVRRTALEAQYAAILASAELAHLFRRLDAWPAALFAAQRSGALKRLKKRLARRLHKPYDRLLVAIADPAQDRHRIRLLVKRLRYACEAYPELAPLDADGRAALKALQTALGDWHDRFLWARRAREESDLASLAADWQAGAATALAQAETLLAELPPRLLSAARA